MNDFLNPYNFVSIPDRATLPAELADAAPPGHDRYLGERWHGSIPITVTTATPLLIPDHSAALTRADPEDTSLPVRTAGGAPVLAGSAVKGMLRSAYEAVTNSRFGVFDGERRLALRPVVNDALNLRPAVVTRRDADSAVLTVVQELRPHDRRVVSNKPNPAVSVRRSLIERHADTEEVEAWIQLFHYRTTFSMWRANEVGAPGTLSVDPVEHVPDDGSPLSATTLAPIRVRARVHKTESRLLDDRTRQDRKHSERLVVLELLGDAAETVHHHASSMTVDATRLAAWEDVIDSYVAAHRTEAPRALRDEQGTYVTDPQRWRPLAVGRTLYVELAGRDLVALVPALVGRRPYPGVPRDDLPAAHRPATALDELSPADRVFGWVRQEPDRTGDDFRTRRAAYRGHLRVEPGARPGRTSLLSFDPLPLATLNSPKPAQFRSYLADATGTPLAGADKNAAEGYGAPSGRRLRGRKVYLTHPDTVHAPHYWTPGPGTDDPRQGRIPVTLTDRTRRPYETYREFKAPTGFKPRVTTMISQWVRPGHRFGFVLHVDNLSRTELGALLWLLTLDDDCYHKIGLGKPLGFGAVWVRADLAAARLYTGASLAARYHTLAARPAAEAVSTVESMRDDLAALVANHPDLRTVTDEFRHAARGYSGHPVHHPRSTTVPQAESYRWWVANDKPEPKPATNRGRYRPAPPQPDNTGARTTFPRLTDDPPLLPLDPRRHLSGT